MASTLSDELSSEEVTIHAAGPPKKKTKSYKFLIVYAWYISLYAHTQHKFL